MRGPASVRTALLLAVLAAPGCEAPEALAIPTAEQVEAYYDSDLDLGAEVVGNVATIAVSQDPQQIRRGGTLWAKVGPYVFLFTEETHSLFEAFPGLAGVRVVTRVGGAEVASALLGRDALSDVLWQRGKNIAGRARRDGSSRVTLLEDLVEWGESYTEFEYNSRFIRR